MNRYPTEFAPRSWGPNLKPWLVRLCEPIRRYKQSREAGLQHIDVRGVEQLQASLNSKDRLLIAPNHSSHADPFTIYAACDAAKTTCHIMAAWHVFMKFSPIMQRCLQWHGCFSVDREANDIGAFRNAIEVLRLRAEPLVIFPEGEIYHCNDRVMPFREGAAAIAVGAARKTDVPVSIVPTAIKYRYLDDPTPAILRALDDIERRILWRTQSHKPIVERLYAIAEAVITLKELEYLGCSRSGELTSRLRELGEDILRKQELKHGQSREDGHPVRVKELRRTILTKANDCNSTVEEKAGLSHDLDDLFVVTQLFSYPGDYLRTEKPSIERIAETVDKLEEDVLQRHTASIRGKRIAVVQFGSPIGIATTKSRTLVNEITSKVQTQVQSLLDGLAM